MEVAREQSRSVTVTRCRAQGAMMREGPLRPRGYLISRVIRSRGLLESLAHLVSRWPWTSSRSLPNKNPGTRCPGFSQEGFCFATIKR